MSHTEVLKDVPNAKVAEIKSSFEQEGASVIVKDQGNGLSTLVATFPDPPVSETAKAALALGAKFA